jgi:hypothetical protein
MQISADSHLYVYGSRLSDALVADVTLGEYHRLAMTIDFLNRETNFSIDGIELAIFPFDDALQSTVFRSATITAAAPTDQSLANSAQYTAYFDDYVVASIPEPSTAVLLMFSLVLIIPVQVSRRMQDRAYTPAGTRL